MNGVEICQPIRQYMAALVDRQNYTEAIKYYECHRKELEGVGGSQAGEVIHLAAQAHASLTQLPIALKVARTAQHLVSQDGDSLLLAEVFLTIGGVLREMGEFKEAEKALRDAESIFRRNDCKEGQCRALNTLAGLFFRQSEFNSSLTVMMDAIEIARKLGDKKKLASMMRNVGRIQTFVGNLDEAEKNLAMNIELTAELNDNTHLAKTYLSLGYILMQKMEYDRAEETFDKAWPLIVQSGNRMDEAIYLTYVGEMHYRCGRFAESGDVLNQALSLAREIAPDSAADGRVLRHLAELYVRLGEFRNAERNCARSWVIFEKADNRVEMGALCRIRAAIAEAGKRKVESRDLYIRSINLLGEANVLFEKAEALVAAGKSELFTLRQKLTYLFRAEELFARCKQVRKQREVERLIESLDRKHLAKTNDKISKPGKCSETDEYHTTSPEIIQFKKQLPLIGRSDLPLLITGETGVGKDHLARYFQCVVRPDGPFVAINCASLPETLLESELFGYSKGAFTGAEKDKAGLFVAANEGVLFLDEIGDMPLDLQTKLLGVLENRRLIPLGSTKAIELDIKIVAATNKKLELMAEQGSFRRDLYYRLSGVSFEIPPLRNRKQDIPLLLNMFMKRCGLSNDNTVLPTELVQQFIEYDWPGNTRELFNKVKRLEVMSQMVAEGDLVELARSMFQGDMPTGASSLFERVEEFERKILLEALLAAQGNKSEAARILGIHEATVRTKLKRYGVSAGRCH